MRQVTITNHAQIDSNGLRLSGLARHQMRQTWSIFYVITSAQTCDKYSSQTCDKHQTQQLCDM